MSNLSLTVIALILVLTTTADSQNAVPDTIPSPTPATENRLHRPPKTSKPTSKLELQTPWPDDNPHSPMPPINGPEKAAKELFEKAKILLDQKNPEAALPLLKEAEKLEPNRFAIAYLIATTLLMLQQYDNAASYYRKAIALNSLHPYAHFGLCQTLSGSGKRIEATYECLEAVRLAPDRPDLRIELARIYILDERLTDAAQVLEEIYASSQNNVVFLGTLGDAYYLDGNYTRAAELYEKIAQGWPKISVTYLRLSGVYDYLGRLSDSIDEAQKFVELRPADPLSNFNLGVKLKGAGFFEESLVPLQKAVSLDNKFGPAYMTLSESYEVLGDKENALAALKQAYKLMPHTASLSYRVGKTLVNFGERTEAIEPLENANTIMPNQPDIMRMLGFAYLEVNKYDEGVSLIEQAEQISPLPPNIRIDMSRIKQRNEILDRFDELVEFAKKNPDDLKAHYELAEAYLFKGMIKETEHEYLEMIRIAPNFKNYNGLAIFYEDQRQFEKALEAMRKAIELNPNHVFYLSLSNIFLKLGRIDEALAAAKRSVEIKSTLLESRLWLGDIYLKKGLREDALREFQAGFDLASGDARPNFRLAWLYIVMGNKEAAFRHYGILRGITPNELSNLELCLRAHFGNIP